MLQYTLRIPKEKNNKAGDVIFLEHVISEVSKLTALLIQTFLQWQKIGIVYQK